MKKPKTFSELISSDLAATASALYTVTVNAAILYVALHIGGWWQGPRSMVDVWAFCLALNAIGGAFGAMNFRSLRGADDER